MLKSYVLRFGIFRNSTDIFIIRPGAVLVKSLLLGVFDLMKIVKNHKTAYIIVFALLIAIIFPMAFKSVVYAASRSSDNEDVIKEVERNYYSADSVCSLAIKASVYNHTNSDERDSRGVVPDNVFDFSLWEKRSDDSFERIETKTNDGNIVTFSPLNYTDDYRDTVLPSYDVYGLASVKHTYKVVEEVNMQGDVYDISDCKYILDVYVHTRADGSNVITAVSVNEEFYDGDIGRVKVLNDDFEALMADYLLFDNYAKDFNRKSYIQIFNYSDLMNSDDRLTPVEGMKYYIYKFREANNFGTAKKVDELVTDQNGYASLYYDSGIAGSEADNPEGHVRERGLTAGSYYLEAEKNQAVAFGFENDNTGRYYFDVEDVELDPANPYVIFKENSISRDNPIISRLIKGNIEISYMDITLDSGVPGAVLELSKKVGDTYRPIESVRTISSGIMDVSGLDWGEYKLEEIRCPSGYGVADNLSIDAMACRYFRVGPLLQGQSVVKTFPVENDFENNIEFKKIPNVKIVYKYSDTSEIVTDYNVVIKKDDQTISEWTLRESSEQFVVGDSLGQLQLMTKYSVSLKSVPSGYITPDVASFRVNNNGRVSIYYSDFVTAENNTIIIKLIPITGSVILDKVDKATNLPLGGSAFKLFDHNDRAVNVIYRDGYYEYSPTRSVSSVQEMEVPANGSSLGTITVRKLPYGQYYFLETAATGGYSVDTNKIRFSIGYDGETVRVKSESKSIAEPAKLILSANLSMQGASIRSGFTCYLKRIESNGTVTTIDSRFYNEGKATTSVKYTFDPIEFGYKDINKTYKYRIEQKIGTLSGVTYDESVYNITVNVIGYADGYITLKVKVGDEEYKGEVNNGLYAPTAVSFVNKYLKSSSSSSSSSSKPNSSSSSTSKSSSSSSSSKSSSSSSSSSKSSSSSGSGSSSYSYGEDDDSYYGSSTSKSSSNSNYKSSSSSNTGGKSSSGSSSYSNASSAKSSAKKSTSTDNNVNYNNSNSTSIKPITGAADYYDSWDDSDGNMLPVDEYGNVDDLYNEDHDDYSDEDYSYEEPDFEIIDADEDYYYDADDYYYDEYEDYYDDEYYDGEYEEEYEFEDNFWGRIGKMINAVRPKSPAKAAVGGVLPLSVLFLMILLEKCKWSGALVTQSTRHVKVSRRRYSKPNETIQDYINSAYEMGDNLDILRREIRRSGSVSRLSPFMMMRFEVKTPGKTILSPIYSINENKFYEILKRYENSDCIVTAYIFKDEVEPEVTLDYYFGDADYSYYNPFISEIEVLDFDKI